jgi:hypothetical protein
LEENIIKWIKVFVSSYKETISLLVLPVDFYTCEVYLMLRVTRQSYPSNNAMFFFTENSQNRYDEVTGGPGASKDK